MFRKMAEKIVFFLLCKGMLDLDKREVYEYAVYDLVQHFICGDVDNCDAAISKLSQDIVHLW